MDCGEIKEYIYPFLDSQLDTQTAELIREHLSTCPVCSFEFGQEKKIDSLIRSSIPKEKAPYELKEAILDRIKESAGPKQVFIFPLPKPAIRVALTLLFIGILIIPILVNINKPFPVFGESIRDHIKFLQGNLTIDIASDNPVEVQRLLQAKLDFKVKVPDLSSQGARLLGGRLCAFKDKKTAFLMYDKKGHDISVFMFDAQGVKFPQAKRLSVNNKIFYLTKEKGFNSVLWIDEGIACVFVSDLGEAELLHLASM